MKLSSKVTSKVTELRNVDSITRQHIAELLALIGRPGTKKAEKIEAVKQLNLQNSQGHRVEDDLEGYSEF